MTNIVHDLREFRAPPDGIVLTIGNFDGVHVGHRLLVETTCRKARDLGVPAVVMTFEPHPISVLFPHRAPARLTTLTEKLAILANLEPNYAIVLRSTPELLHETADEFLRYLVESCRPRAIIEGPTFNFGRGRQGSVDTLRAQAARYNYEVIVLDELHSSAVPGQPAVNSTAIRHALRLGRVEDARQMLGRPYRITGLVSDGKHLGHTIGFPTANLERVPQLLPGHAVYAAVGQLEDDSLHLAAVNIGPQPTFSDDHTRVEAYLLDYSGHLRTHRLGLYLLARLRDQRRFDDVASLTEQLRRDVEAVRALAPALAELRAGPLLGL